MTSAEVPQFVYVYKIVFADVHGVFKTEFNQQVHAKFYKKNSKLISAIDVYLLKLEN